MNKIFNSIDLIPEIQWVIAIILIILVFATVLFWIWNKLLPSKLVDEIQVRTRSWWIMCFIFLFASLINPVVTYIALGLLSFFTLREIYSLLNLREMDRSVLFFCYLCIPIQYYLAFKGYDKKYGARPLQRLIQKEIKECLAEEILFGKLKKGGLVKIDSKDEKIIFSFS